MVEFNELKKNMQQRVINVFVSSTFRDMQAERDELVKKIFPQLRKICEQRGVTWGEVDLRWGITDEQKAEGKVLPICLAEIEHCRPYFIGILGERYGWIDDEISANVLKAYNWLKDYKGKSVTELEILHGVLRNPEMADHTFFYFRDPSYLDSINEKDRINYCEAPAEDEIKKYGLEKAEKLAAERENKLLKLKNVIKESGFPFKENYSNPRDLGELVYNDLKTVIDELYPEKEKPDPLEQTRLEHESFAIIRFNIYIQNENYFNRLDEHVKNNDLPLVVIGESGSGKSALLANWAKKYTESTKDKYFILTHYVGATSDSADWINMLRRIMNELKQHFNIQQNIPDDQNKLKAEFANWLHIVASKERVILIIDALNQLENFDGALDLSWLPEYIPENVRLIVSSLPGRSLDELKKRRWHTLEVKPLDVDERSKLIKDYLSQYKKSLSAQMVGYIASHDQVSNPLYLRALLEEIRLYGDHFTLPQIIDHYLKALTIEDLYTTILERYERDYDEDRKNLVKDVFSCLWAARKGLTSTELLDLMGSNEGPLPGAFWYPLSLAAEKSMINRAGLLSFSHDYFRNAVYKRYISTENEKKHYHLLLANYFEERELGDRKVDELPWQLDQAESWKRLKESVTDLEMFMELNKDNKKYELIKYWYQLKDKYEMVNEYKKSIEKKVGTITDEELAKLYNKVGYFLFDVDEFDDAEAFLRESLGIYEKSIGSGELNTISAMCNLARFLRGRGTRKDYNESVKLFQRALNLYEQTLSTENEIVADTMVELAISQTNIGNFSDIDSLLDKSLKIYKNLNISKDEKLAYIMSIKGSRLRDKGSYADAEKLLKKSIKICEEKLGLHETTAYSYLRFADFLKMKKDYDSAASFYRSAIQIYEKLLGKENISTISAMDNLAVVLAEKGNLDEAELIFRRCLEVYEKLLPEVPDTAAVMNNLALVMYRKGNLKDAEPLFYRSLQIYDDKLGPNHYKTKDVKDNLELLNESPGMLSKIILTASSLIFYITIFGITYYITKNLIISLIIVAFMFLAGVTYIFKKSREIN